MLNDVHVQAVEATDDSPAILEHTTVETPMNMSPENKAHFEAEKEAIHLILTGIGDEIYSTTTVNVAGAREKVGSPVVQKSGIQCFNCKEYGHFTKECKRLKRVKDSAYHKEKMLLCKQAEQGTDSEPLEQVQTDAGYNVFANDLQHSEQSESVSNTCLVETYDSNVIPDSPDICEDDIQNDQNDVESDDERVTLANLIANLKLDAEFENYKAFNDRTIDYDKLERKLNETLGELAQKDIEIKDGLNTKAYELLVVKEKHDELIKQSLLTKSHYEGLVKQKTKVPTYNGRPTFANPRYIKQAQSEIPCLYAFPYDQSTHANRLIPDKEETLALERESRSKLNKDLVHPYDYTALNSLYEIYKPPTQEYEIHLAHANEIRRKMVYYVEGLNYNLFSVGQFYDADLEVAFRKSTCFVRDLQGNDLLTGNRGSDLYTFFPQESTSSTPLCLVAKASPTQAWLWHRRLSHLNFDYINLLLKKDIVIGLPKLKDGENLDKIKEKRDPCILVGYPTQSKGYRFYNKRTRMIDESIHILFDEIKEVSNMFVANNTSGLVPQRQKASDYDNPNPIPQRQDVSSLADAHVPSQQELDLLFGPLYDEFFNGGSNPQDKQPSTNIQSTSAPSTPTNVHAKENNDNQAEEGEQLQDDKFTNHLCVSTQEEAESFSHNIGNSNVPTFNQPQVSEYQWTKDHPLEQVRGNPSRPVQTRQQLATDPEMYMYTLTVSTAEPKYIKEVMPDSAWIEAM
uniref:Retrovirus-related Pol polyprotein from transposon TNT 1-94 n=1 Tax=Tanacetum cinerariifolium TaxID=118510 RepID=A0A6L2LWG5_TANCI|nr:retrovirus-related Pol polyprotein from transposon TNT 1-94 [Tanacetum cinerariifolium]